MKITTNLQFYTQQNYLSNMKIKSFSDKQKLKYLVMSIPKGNNKGHSSGRRIIALAGSSKIQKETENNKKGKCQPNIMNTTI